MFAERLKKLRLEANLTQKQIAEHLKISQPAYAQWETGKLNPKKETIQMFAEYFNVSYSYLSGDSDFKQNSEPEIFFRKAVSDMNLTKEQEEQFQKDVINFIEQRRKIFEEDEK
ncbi:XRE family transcriptional regulator [Streptococcus minor]|uniref:XRE family transcriptional regulator n=1 Tax=Streptococcus minor TaxID=229549 RepID=A0A3P1VCY9_9STRE|nr:helix-turn-helix transcriptional regulator [Streptococcus minor]RRD31486.1 XRE family transcriptional regulator [Streptococcus minor]